MELRSKSTSKFKFLKVFNRQESKKKRKHPVLQEKALKIPEKTNNIISYLPVEILLKFFEYIPEHEICDSVRFVCTQWYSLLKHVTVTKLEIDGKTPTKTLKRWLLVAPQLKYFIAKNRRDLNAILEVVSLKCKQLQSLELNNCWGSQWKRALSTVPFSHVLTNCTQLRKIRLNQIRLVEIEWYGNILDDDALGFQLLCGPPFAPPQEALLLVNYPDNIEEQTFDICFDQETSGAVKYFQYEVDIINLNSIF